MGAVPLQPDEIFAGSYRILRRLASGGMGAVYLAEQLATGRERALKRMHFNLADNPQLRSLFEREVRVGNKIRSEHVVKVLDAGIDRDSGAPWLTMELLHGENLREEIERAGPPPLPRATDILMQICHGLAAAHRAGVVHRDLKPANIMVCPSEREGSALLVKILDFGLARFADATSSQRTPMGTPEWMAPEQASLDHIGRGADVFSLALVAYYLLTGKVYWSAPVYDPLAVLHELLYKPMARASERAAERGVAADVLPEGFDDWFAKATTRNPEDRFPDAAAAREVLKEVLNLRPSAPPTEPPQTPPRSSSQAPPLVLQQPGAAYDPAWYVPRWSEETEAIKLLRAPGQPATILAPKQFGKTWLLRRIVGELVASGGYSAAVLQTHLLGEGESLEVFLRSFAAALLDACGRDSSLLESEWRAAAPAEQKIVRLLERRILGASDLTFVLALDSVDVLRGSAAGSGFFALLRDWAGRTERPWSKLRLLFSASAAPAALREAAAPSPFDLAPPVLVRPLDAPQVTQLASLHNLTLRAAELSQIMAYSSGHVMVARRFLHRAASDHISIRSAVAAEVSALVAWYRELGLRDAVRALDEDSPLDAEARGQLVRYGVAIEQAGGALEFTTPFHHEAARDIQ